MLADPRVTWSRASGFPPALGRVIARRLRRACSALPISARATTSLGLRIVSDAEMQALNERHRGERKSTDVLSFPSGFEVLDLDEGDEHGPAFVGDIAVSWPATLSQATAPGSTGAVDEAVRLFVHGIVHLLGHDHATTAQGRRMHAQERRALRAARTPDVPRIYARTRGADTEGSVPG